MRTAIYALSADPITYGHIDVIKRALRVFDCIVVGVGNNPSKKYTFSLQERVNLAEKALSGLSVEVLPFEGLLVDFAYSKNIQTVLRGVRNNVDFEFEQILHDINYSQRMGIDTFLVIADQGLSHVSSSAVKELQAHSAKEILDYVPMPIKQALEERLCRQVRVGVTGEIGAGKSFFVEKYVDFFRKRYKYYGTDQPPLGIVDVDLDTIARNILTTESDQICDRVRQTISFEFNVPLLENSLENSKRHRFLDIKALSEKIFSDEAVRRAYNDIMIEPILYFLRKDYFSKHGNFIFIGSALLADCGGSPIVNNNVIVVTADENIRRKRLTDRGYSEQEISRRMNAQLPINDKMRLITESIENNAHGSLYIVDNSDGISNQEMGKIDSWVQAIPQHLA